MISNTKIKDFLIIKQGIMDISLINLLWLNHYILTIKNRYVLSFNFGKYTCSISTNLLSGLFCGFTTYSILKKYFIH